MKISSSLLALAFLGALAFTPACSDDVSLGNGSQQGNLDQEKVCATVLTCVDGQQYPTACGPSNGDKALGPCEEPAPTCDPTMICTQAITCVGGPTTVPDLL